MCATRFLSAPSLYAKKMRANTKITALKTASPLLRHQKSSNVAVLFLSHLLPHWAIWVRFTRHIAIYGTS